MASIASIRVSSIVSSPEATSTFGIETKNLTTSRHPCAQLVYFIAFIFQPLCSLRTLAVEEVYPCRQAPCSYSGYLVSSIVGLPKNSAESACAIERKGV
jgi:hypothetical protein